MDISIPDDILEQAMASEGDVRLALAIAFYADNRLDYNEACRLAGLGAAEMNRQLLTRGYSLQQYPSVRRAC